MPRHNLTLTRNPVTSVFGIIPNRIKLLLFGLFILGAVLKTLDIGQPIGVDNLLSWRETDISGIARNFYREVMNLFYPRIDWRGDGPAYVEMEFPLYPWLISGLTQDEKRNPVSTVVREAEGRHISRHQTKDFSEKPATCA
ncbi:hypothetical protein [Microseira wollei]|nr:hypothetical protein [Microseira wollei]